MEKCSPQWVHHVRSRDVADHLKHIQGLLHVTFLAHQSVEVNLLHQLLIEVFEVEQLNVDEESNKEKELEHCFFQLQAAHYFGFVLVSVQCSLVST